MSEQQELIYSYLKKSRYFQHITEETLRKLLVLAKFRNYKPGETILFQGKENRDVYCIVRGSVAVMMDGMYIYSLRRSGDIFGEMSVITGSLSSATVQAEKDLELIVISLASLGDSHEDITHELHYMFYKWFSSILSNKLYLTSQKAKLYEDRTAELEQEHLTLMMGYRKLEDMHDNNEQLLDKIGTIDETHFAPLHNALNHLKDESLSESGLNRLHEALRQVGQIQQILKPVAKLYQTNQAIQKKRVLLAETNRKQQIVAKMALGGSGLELDIVSNVEEGMQRLKDNHYDLICSNVDLIELVTRAQEGFPHLQSVLMTAEDVDVYLPISRKYPFLSNIVSRSYEDRAFTLKSIITTVSKLISNDIFGLDKYLTWGIEVRKRQVERSDTRGKLVMEMEQYFAQLGVRRAVLGKCMMVAEELLMNAIYDAPVDVNGQPLYNHLPRTTVIELPAPHQGTFQYACDGLLLAISVEDPFGAFDRKTILDYLERGYKGELGSVANKGGAGRGLFQIMNAIDLLVINVKPHVRTEVIAIFNIDPARSKQTKHTSFHYFCD